MYTVRERGAHMMKYFVPVIFVLILLIFAICYKGNVFKSSPDLGTLKTYSYSRSGGMRGEHHGIRITKKDDGTVWLYETKSNVYPKRAEHVTYRYRLSDDAIERIETHLKENGLWVAKPFKKNDTKIMDGYQYSWSFETEQNSYSIYRGMDMTDEIRERLTNLAILIREIRAGSKREKDPENPMIAKDDILGFIVHRDHVEATIFVHPEKGEISIENLPYVATGMTAEQLLNEIKALYLQNKNVWGDQVLDRYPMELNEDTEKSPYVKNALYLIVKNEDMYKPYVYLLKFSGDVLPKEMEQFMDQMTETLRSRTTKVNP